MKLKFATGAIAVVLSAFTFQLASANPTDVAAIDQEVVPATGQSFRLGHVDTSKVLHIAVSLPYRNQEAVEAYADSVSDPKSPNYRKFLKPEEVGRRFGLSSTQVQEVADYLTSNGIKVTLVAKNHLSILADATVAQAEKAFHTSIDRFQTIDPSPAGNRDFYANSGPVMVPKNLVNRIMNVSGLESFTKPMPRILTCTQTRGLYNLAPEYSGGYQGQGRAVAISNWDGFRLTNVPLYYSHFGLPTPAGGVGSNVHVVAISGGAGSGTPQGEGDLDIQMVLGMAPLAEFYIYDGGSSDLIGVLTREVNDNIADVISESWGWNIGSSTANACHNLHLSMTTQGITYMAASGDNGTTLEPYSYPNYDPEVMMVGGTVATVNGSNVRTSETGWNGSGGGWSTKAVAFNTRPSWQTGTGVPTNINFRLSPDVALNASGSSGAYQFYLNGSLTSGYVGTSFACPVFAGGLGAASQKFIALGGLPADGAGKRRFGRIQNLIYGQNGRSDVWFDVTSGNNGTLPNGSSSNAGAGWDFVTGWGAINWDSFVNVLAGSLSAPAAPTNLAATAGNGQISLTWTASANATGYKVFRSTTSGSGYSQVGTPSATNFTDSPLTNGTQYFYVVKATNSIGDSGNSNEANATPNDGNLLLNGGFESGHTAWTDEGNVISNGGSEPARTGSWKAVCAGTGHKGTFNLYQAVTLPSTVTTATVSFYLHIDTAETSTIKAFDTLKVQVRNSSGTVLKTFTTFNNLMAASGFQNYQFNLKPYRGQTVQICFLSKENGKLATNFVVDDVLVAVTP